MKYALITTGGTIAGLRTDETHYSSARLSGEDWAEHMGLGTLSASFSPTGSKAVPSSLAGSVPSSVSLSPDTVDGSPPQPIQWCVYSPYSIGSQNLSWAHLFELRSVLCEVLEDPSMDGVLVTHGTDTMEDTLFFLSCTVPVSMWRIPVVFTGSMLTSDSPHSDAAGNLHGAVNWLNTQSATQFGLWMNHRFIPAAEVRKWRTFGVDAFDSSSGFVDSWTNPPSEAHNIDFQVSHPQTIPSHTSSGLIPYSELPVFQLPPSLESFKDLVVQYPVHVLYWSPMLLNNPLLKVSAWPAGGCLIVAAPGNGNIPESILKPLRRLMDKGVRVVRASRISTSELRTGGELTGLEAWINQTNTMGLSLYAEAHYLSLSQVVAIETLRWVNACVTGSGD